MVDNAIDLDADSVARSCVGDTPSNGSEVGARVMRQFRQDYWLACMAKPLGGFPLRGASRRSDLGASQAWQPSLRRSQLDPLRRRS
jgi:hypothetical protein